MLILKAGEVNLIVPGAHARNGSLLHDARWQALNLTLEGNRTALEGPIPSSALTDALEVLGRLKSWYVAHDYRDWYNRLASSDTAGTADTADAADTATPAAPDRALDPWEPALRAPWAAPLRPRTALAPGG